LRHDELIHADVMCQVHVDEATRREEQRTDHHQEARVKPFHEKRHGREQDQLWQAAPHHHVADLFGIVALDLGAIDRDDVDRTERDRAEHGHQEAAAPDRPIFQHPQIDEGFGSRELADHEARDAENRKPRALHNHRRAEPVFALPFLKYEG
jgi:hypothetical protein